MEEKIKDPALHKSHPLCPCEVCLSVQTFGSSQNSKIIQIIQAYSKIQKASIKNHIFTENDSYVRERATRLSLTNLAEGATSSRTQHCTIQS